MQYFYILILVDFFLGENFHIFSNFPIWFLHIQMTFEEKSYPNLQNIGVQFLKLPDFHHKFKKSYQIIKQLYQLLYLVCGQIWLNLLVEILATSQDWENTTHTQIYPTDVIHYI